MTRRHPPSIRWWEWVFPLVAIGFPLWATIPDLPHFCGFWEWSLFCGMGAIFRFDVLLPALFPIAIWALIRTGRLWRRLQALELEVGIQGLEQRVEEKDRPPEVDDSRTRRFFQMLERELKKYQDAKT